VTTAGIRLRLAIFACSLTIAAWIASSRLSEDIFLFTPSGRVSLTSWGGVCVAHCNWSSIRKEKQLRIRLTGGKLQSAWNWGLKSDGVYGLRIQSKSESLTGYFPYWLFLFYWSGKLIVRLKSWTLRFRIADWLAMSAAFAGILLAIKLQCHIVVTTLLVAVTIAAISCDVARILVFLVPKWQQIVRTQG